MCEKRHVNPRERSTRRSKTRRPPARSPSWVRPLRIAGAFLGALAVLYLALASPLSRQTEVSWAVPFGLLPIALLLGVGATIQELAQAGSVARRDGLFGLASALVSFAILRLSGAF